MNRRKTEAMSDERLLVQKLQSGDADAFRELVETYKQQVYYTAYDLSGNHHDAEDLSQEVFIKAFRGIGRFRSDARLGSWLHRITMNAYIDSRRKKARKMVTLVDKREENDFDPLEAATDKRAVDPETSAASVGIAEHVDEALRHLTDQERVVFVMRHYHEMPLKDISRSLKIAEGTVKSLLFRSIRKMRGRLSFYREELGLEENQR
jgi:RNA polymerase sigma-70 factor (ECF subfamily)